MAGKKKKKSGAAGGAIQQAWRCDSVEEDRTPLGTTNREASMHRSDVEALQVQIAAMQEEHQRQMEAMNTQMAQLQGRIAQQQTVPDAPEVRSTNLLGVTVERVSQLTTPPIGQCNGVAPPVTGG